MSALTSFGKLILLGEHAAVYGSPALALGIPSALRATALRPTSGGIRLRVPDWGLERDSEQGHSGQFDSVVAAMRALLRRLPGRGGCELAARARIPLGAGLGGSAALALLLVRALASTRGVALTTEEARVVAHELEKVFHGIPSGLDDGLSAFGGLCLFRRGGFAGQTDLAAGGASSTKGGSPRVLLGRLRPIADDLLAFPVSPPRLVIGLTGVARQTSSLVAGVAARYAQDGALIGEIFGGIEACVVRGAEALLKSDLPELGRAMTRNQELLRQLQVSSVEIDTLVESALDNGALGAKLTGAGGGGAVVALAPGREEVVLAAWAARGFAGLDLLLEPGETDSDE